MNNEFALFLKKLSVLLALLFAVDFSLGNLLEYFYFRMKPSAPEHFLTYSLDEAAEDIIVFGSSRAQHHYNPEPFEEKLNRSFYNTGQDGQGILYSYVVLQSILERSSKPRILLLDLNPNEFHAGPEDKDKLTELLPYYHRNDAVKTVLDLKRPLERYKATSYLYRYNSLALTILAHNLSVKGDKTIKGFEPLENKVWRQGLETYAAEERIDSVEVTLFENFLLDAKNANCEVIVVVSPSFRKFTANTQSIEIAESICRRLGIRFLNYNQDSRFLSNPNLFVDPTHLNENGAALYSELVASKLAPRTLSTSQSLDNWQRSSGAL